MQFISSNSAHAASIFNAKASRSVDVTAKPGGIWRERLAGRCTDLDVAAGVVALQGGERGAHAVALEVGLDLRDADAIIFEVLVHAQHHRGEVGCHPDVQNGGAEDNERGHAELPPLALHDVIVNVPNRGHRHQGPRDRAKVAHCGVRGAIVPVVRNLPWYFVIIPKGSEYCKDIQTIYL